MEGKLAVLRADSALMSWHEHLDLQREWPMMFANREEQVAQARLLGCSGGIASARMQWKPLDHSLVDLERGMCLGMWARKEVLDLHGLAKPLVVKAGVQPRKASMFLEFLNILPVHDG
jgi:hypothetical protein